MCLLADRYQVFAGDVLVDCAGESCGIQFLKLHVFRDGHDIGSVGLVEGGQEGKELIEVRVDRAILQRGVRGGVVGERRHLDLDARRLGLATRLDTGLLGINNNEL